ncbi:AF4/FMR2 family member 4-like [Liolophura sinensis]|uniref:AF4/FMR2 family member 4-like n=1 Tax=Liolophura sinensis TaxID=3198878 RepID=UPI0031595FAC
MSSMSSNTCTTALSHPISGTLDSTDSREDDAHQDLLTDSFNDSAVEDDTPRLSSKHDSSRSSEVKLEVKCESSKDTCANDNTATTLLGNSCVTKESNGGSVGSTGSVPDPSEDIITQLWDSRPVQPVRKWKYPKDGGSESKHPKPSPKTTKRSEPSPMRDSKSRDDTEVETKSPSKTSKRRSSTSSTSSHQSQKDKAKRRKCDKDSIVNKDKVERVKEEVVESKLKNGDSELRMTASPCLDISKGTMRASRLISNHRLLPAEDYLVEAKRLKHEADSLGDKKHRSLIYLEAVLSFILSGYAMEQEQICDSTRYFKMYTDTLALLKYTHMGRFRNNHHDSDGPGVEKQLTVLSLRIQSLLCLKLFKLKKAETLRLKKVIDDHNKMSSKPTASAPSPHQTSWNSRGTGTPSPMSPTPSPAGSIGSVGSQSSNCDVNPSKLANGNLSTGTLSSPGCVSVPQRIHSITSQYISHTSYLVQAMDLWDQGDAASAECGDFFERLELETKVLSLHSSIRELVHYVQRGLARLKDT